MKPRPGNREEKLIRHKDKYLMKSQVQHENAPSFLHTPRGSPIDQSHGNSEHHSFLHSFHESQPVRTVPTLLLRTSSRSMHVTITSPFLLPPPNLPLLCKVQSPSRATLATAFDKTSPYPDSYRSVQESVSVKNKSRKQKTKGSRTPSQHIPPLKTHPNQNPPLLKFLHHLSIQPLKLLKPPLKNSHINIPTR